MFLNSNRCTFAIETYYKTLPIKELNIPNQLNDI